MVRSSSTMLLFIVFLQMSSALKADYSVKCVNETNSRTIFGPSKDGVSGRYDVEWCTAVTANTRRWELELSYNLNRTQINCRNAPHYPAKHSAITTLFEHEDVNCTHMCFYTSIDMVFNGCFELANWLPDKGTQRTLLKEYINDSVPRQAYAQNIINADALKHEDHVAVHWYLDKVVATTYEMRLCENRTAAAGERKIIQNQVYVPLPKEDRCEQINDKCNVTLPKRNEIICRLRHLNGSYYIELTHSAPWKNCDLFSKQVYTHYSFNVTDGLASVSPPPPPAASPALAWACGALLVLCAAAAVAVFVWRSRLTRRFQQRVHSHWTCGDKPGIEPVAVAPDNTARAVLLLYAREGDLGEPLIRAITDLLQQSRIKVLDLYSPEVVSVSAPAPGDWLRDMLQRRDVRVLLLQTPALAAIYGDRASPPEPDADFALLHRRVKVVPAEPAPSDALLAMALRLLAEDVHTPAPYNKYYLATLESLETDTLPYIVPFRRYALPADAARLALDLRPGPALPAPPAPPGLPADALQALRYEANAFLQHVRERPGYLADHLLLLE